MQGVLNNCRILMKRLRGLKRLRCLRGLKGQAGAPIAAAGFLHWSVHNVCGKTVINNGYARQTC